MYAYLESRHPQILTDIAGKKQIDDTVKGALNNALKEFATDFAARKSAAA
jgi:F0F1-type ATP synthase alpha subunit